MERRSSLRKQIHHGAILKLPSGTSWPCVIADYCSQGMFLRFSADASKTISRMAASIREQSLIVVFDGQKVGRQFKVVAKSVRIIPGAMGVQFVDRFDDAVHALDRVSEATQSSRDGKTKLSTETKVILSECLDHLKKTVAPRFSKIYPDIVEALRTAAKTAVSDTHANEMMDASALFERESKRVHRLFLDGIHNPFTGEPKALEETSSAESLSLVGKGEFEDWLTTRVLTTKTETLYRGLLLQLKMRLEALGIEEKDNQNSLGPALIIHSFHSALVAVNINLQAERTIYRELEKKVLHNLEDVYVELNNVFIRHNILPGLDLTKHIKKHSNRTRVAKPLSPEKNFQGDTGKDTAQIGYDTLVSHGQSVSADQQNIADITPPFAGGYAPFKQDSEDGKHPLVGFQHSQEQAKAAYHNAVGLIKSLRAAQSSPVTPEPSDSPAENWSETELRSGLQDLQIKPVEMLQENQPRLGLMDRILETLPQGDQGPKVIAEEKQEAIDVVDRFFVSLKENPRLSLEAKNHLLKLEIPVLKVLLQNAEFFEDVTSPVHGVMNRVAQLGTKGARLNPANKKKVSSVVQRIAEEFKEDTAVFDDAVGELDRIIDRHNILYTKNVERVAAAADGVHRVNQAKLAVGRALNKRLGKGLVPSSVITLVNAGWRDLLQLTHIKHGPESEEWYRYLKIIDELIHFGNNPEQGIDVTAVLSQIHDGLSELSNSDDIAPKVRDALQLMLQTKNAADIKMAEANLDEDVISEDEQERRNAEKSRYLRQWIRRAKAMEVGSWLQFNKDDQETQYMRLVWVAKAYTKFVFVNHQGMKVVELGLLKVASYLKDGVIIPDPDYELPIMNQGLDAMVKDVYDKLALQSGHDKDTGLATKKEFCKAVQLTMKKGKPEEPCSILYIRFSPFVNLQEVILERGFVDKAALSIEECANNSAIIGRINDRDFVVFSKNDELDMLDVRVGEVLEQLCREEKDKKKRLVVSIHEARGSLSSESPEEMISRAAAPLQDGIPVATQKHTNESPGHKEGKVIPGPDRLELPKEKSSERESPERIEGEVVPGLDSFELPKVTNSEMELPDQIEGLVVPGPDPLELAKEKISEKELVEQIEKYMLSESKAISEPRIEPQLDAQARANFGPGSLVPEPEVAEIEDASDEEMSLFDKSGKAVAKEGHASQTRVADEAAEQSALNNDLGARRDSESRDLFAGIDINKLEIRAQRSMSLSDSSVHEEQCELGLFVQGYREPLHSEEEYLARVLDSWWLDQLGSSKVSGVIGAQNISVRVRISGYALRDDQWMEKLHALTADGKINASKIWFDLYKCSVIENVHAAADIIRNSMTKGYRFCLDQFGSVNTPYALMKYLPVDMIKVDEPFIETLNDPVNTEESAESIVEVAHYFGREVLASAVDSAICLQKMKRLEVDYVQGRAVSEFDFLVAPYFEGR